MTPIAPTTFPTRAALTAALALALVAIGVTPAAAQSQDLRSPDTRDAATAAQPAYVDLRSPDARDAARAAALDNEPRGSAPSQDLRSPDTRDAARASATPASPQPVAQPSAPDSDGWLIPAIVGAALALMLATLLTTRRRRRHHAVA